MNGKLDSAYSHHAACRMQQHGIACIFRSKMNTYSGLK